MKTILPLILTAVLSVSCAAKKLAAQNADVILVNQMEKRLPLYADQKKALSKDVDKFLNQQKDFAKEVMPIISSVQLDVQKVDSQYDQLNTLYQRLSVNFSKLMSKYMALLDEKQQKGFSANLNDENSKLTEQKNNDRLEKIYDKFESLFGSITQKQKKIFKAQKNYLAERATLRNKRREQLHAKFKEIYKMELSPEARTTYFIDAFTDYQNSYPDSPKNKEIIKSIIPTLSGSQKEVFIEKTNDLKEIIGHYVDTVY